MIHFAKTRALIAKLPLQLRTSFFVISLSSLPISAAEKWEAVYESLFLSITLRESGGKAYGRNSAYPLLWNNSRYLITGDRFTQFSDSLDRFTALSEDDIESIPAIRRALLQRHLWAVFDWTTKFDQKVDTSFDQEHHRSLQLKIAPLIMRLGLEAEEIQNLPNNFAATTEAGVYSESFDADIPFKPFFPATLYDEGGPWVLLRKTYHSITAKIHTDEAQSRSTFQVFLRLPGDRQATLAYLDKLSKFEKHWVTEKPRLNGRTTPNGGINDVEIFVNPETPQFPVGTQVALVDQALLINCEGKIVASPLTNSVQVRAYLQMEPDDEEGKSSQAFAEFLMHPPALMAGNAVMRAVSPDETNYLSLLVNGDPFTPAGPVPHPARLTSCFTCHSAWGIHSVNSRAEFFQIPRSLQTPRFQVGKYHADSDATIREKYETYSWGLLVGLWRNSK